MCVCLCACVYEYDILCHPHDQTNPHFISLAWFYLHDSPPWLVNPIHVSILSPEHTGWCQPVITCFLNIFFLPQVIYITDFVVKDQLSNLWGPILAREFNPIETHRRHSSYVFSAGLQRSQGSSRILLVAASAGDAQCSRDSNIINEGFNQQTMGNLPSKIKATNL